MASLGTPTLPPIDLGPLAQPMKPSITSLRVNMDSDLKPDSKIKIDLRQPAKIKPVLLRQRFETVIHAFDYSSAWCVGSLVGPLFPKTLQRASFNTKTTKCASAHQTGLLTVWFPHLLSSPFPAAQLFGPLWLFSGASQINAGLD